MEVDVTSAPSAAAADPMWEWALAATVLITLARLAVLRLNPLPLYGDEAEYWVWARHLAWGYATKPPLIAWLVRLTTFAGNAEPFVRLAAPLLQAAAGLFLYGAGHRLYDSRTALFSLLVYELTPAVQLGGFVISTDTPLAACLAAALMAYAAMQSAQGAQRVTQAAILGAVLGLSFLAKYAALYGVIGVFLHLTVSRAARRLWSAGAIWAAVAAFAAVAGPNIAWNAAHGWIAFDHVVREADWGGRKGGVAEAAGFLGSQLGVFGPVFFAVLVVGGAWLALRRKLAPSDTLLLCWAAPPLALVLIQALIAGAKANWAIAAYPPGAVLIAAWFQRWGRPRLLMGLLALHGAAAIAGAVVAVQPHLADRVGLSKALNGVRGPRQLANLVVEQAQAQSLAGPLSAIAIDDRRLFNLCAYYGRDYFSAVGPPLRAWTPGPRPQTQAELASPLTAAFGARVLAVSFDGVNTAAMRAQFRSAGETDVSEVWAGPGRRLTAQSFVGEGYLSPLTPPPGPSRTPPRSWPAPHRS
jgi:4-amino-4-deoxy-L-arabinose transferase-like glycosyltransferase